MGMGSPPCTVTPREAQQLDRDLALVVIHGDDGLELAGLGLQEDGVGRKRPLHRQAFLVQFAHRRRDDVDFLATAGAAIAAMRVEGGHGHARLGTPLACKARWISRAASLMPATLSAAAASLQRDVCEDTREVHRSPSVLNSQKYPVTPRYWAK